MGPMRGLNGSCSVDKSVTLKFEWTRKIINYIDI